MIAQLLGCTLCLSAAQAQSQIPCRYEITATILAPPLGPWSSPTSGVAINSHGDVAGRYDPGGISNHRAFLWKGPAPGTFFTLPFPPGVLEMYAEDLNDAGIVVGTAGQITGNRGFIYDSNTGLTTLLQPGPGGVNCQVFGINATGMVCGTRSIGPGELPTTAFIRSSSGGLIDLGLINGSSTTAAGINDAGAVAGTMLVDGIIHAMLWNGGSVADLGTLAGMTTSPKRINKC